jgi:2-polyprenyl-3-methyl-5-hydroxy-6-metoxy-1,4-benzoquinol methylase
VVERALRSPQSLAQRRQFPQQMEKGVHQSCRCPIAKRSGWAKGVMVSSDVYQGQMSAAVAVDGDGLLLLSSRMREIDNNVRHEACPFCVSTRVRPVGPLNYDRPTIFSTTAISLIRSPELWSCAHCESGFTQNAVNPADSHELYSASNSAIRWAGGAGFAGEKEPGVVAAMSAIFAPGVRVADVGCGIGHLLDFAASFGCKTIGIELSEGCHISLRARGHEVRKRLNDLEDASVEVICAFDLVEHLHDFADFLATCRQKLTPGGALAILTGDIRAFSARLARNAWWYARYPEHVVFPSPKVFAERSGWLLEAALPTFASRGYRGSAVRVAAGSAYRLVRGTFTGLPSLGPDHRLYVLRSDSRTPRAV